MLKTMKIFKISILTIALFAFTLSMTSCGGNSDHAHDNMEEHGTEHMENHSDEQMENHTYTCPMHPEITGKEGDKCSKCGMDLKMAEDEDHDDHSGHDH